MASCTCEPNWGAIERTNFHGDLDKYLTRVWVDGLSATFFPKIHGGRIVKMK